MSFIGTLLVEIGTDNRPVQSNDLHEVEELLLGLLDDEEPTIITHHSFKAKYLQTNKQGVPFIVAKHKPMADWPIND